MKRQFYKYQGTGNDFILLDDRNNSFDITDVKRIKLLCDRRFGIGADGLMLLRNKEGFDFEMVYFNSDGKPSSMCGNGGRCISRFAKDIGAITKNEIRFLAIDGPHEAIIGNETVKLKMNDVGEIENGEDYYFMNTGSPHYVKFTEHVAETDIVTEGKKIRYNERFNFTGTNVNFVEKELDGIFVRTYERGVEDETLSCGTGVTACALASALKGISTSSEKCEVFTRGGNLSVHFKKDGNRFSNIWLEGPAEFVFNGEIEL
ncbi:diaminopimelate epimerase [soil metagenome]